MSTRAASHAGSWYSSAPATLSSELDGWLAQVPDSIDGNKLPVPGARVIIAPHAGYSYSGPAAAWAYKSLDLSKAKRIFLLGPSHTMYLSGCAISSQEYYATPLGNLKLDQATIKELQATSKFDAWKAKTEEAEHSLEMHLPYIYKVLANTFNSPDEFPLLVPVLVGATSGLTERSYGEIFAPYLADPTSVFVVSSDFCHWGERFQYTYYLPASPSANSEGYSLSRRDKTPTNPWIHESIGRIDKLAMDAIEEGKHQGFLDNLKDTGNTVCGRHPIGVVMAALEVLEQEGKISAENGGRFKFVRANKSDTLRLAIGRANGDIEIWNPLNGAWFQETILRGGQDRSVDGLAWVQDPDEEDHDGKIIPGKLRLFSIGYTTTVTEWDLERLQPLRQSSGNHGEIWCLAAQPQLAPGQQQADGAWNGQNLITGCTDGALVLYSTADDDLKLQRVLVRPSAKKAKIISVNFQDRNIVVAGCTDSTIRVYDSRNGSSIRSISLGSGPSGGPKEIIVWAVKCLPNGNIVSGDSTGELRIWDGKTYTLIQRIKSHRQDILSLAASADGSTVFSGGMDRRTVVYKQSGGPKSRWAEVSHKRLHNHDVKTMTSFEGRGMSFVVSGGPDATPIVLPLREFGAENQRMLPYLPQEPIVQSVPAKRLLMSWWDREVHIWRVSKLTQANDNAESDSESEERHRSRKLVAKVIIKGEANINSASVAAHGGLLALSTNSEVKLFQLRSRGGNQGDALRVSKLDLSEKLSRGGARLVQFSPDGQWLVIVRRDNRIVATRIVGDVAKSPSTVRVLPSPAKLSRLDRKVDKATRFGGLGDYERNINRIAFSSDSRILAVSDLAGYIDTWLLKDDGDQNGADSDDIAESDASPESSSDESDSEDATKSITLKGQSWTRNPSTSSLPKLPAAAVVLSFRPCAASIAPETEDRMLVVTATSAVFEFEAKSGKLTPWSRSNPTTKFPDEFKGLRDQAMGCFWDVADSKERLWLYGSKWMFMFDLSRDFPPETEANAQRKRKHMHIAGQDNPRKGTSGAGSKIPDEQLTTGMSRKMQRVIHEDDSSKPREINLRNHVGILDDDEDDDEDRLDYGKGSDEAGGGAQGKLRRGGDVEGGAQAGELTEYGDEEGSSEHPPHWWHTYKYRPIMGIVSLGGGGGEAPAGSSGLEIALVERPEWELELPPRYYGDQEWEKRGL
ncbi:hypothetical protein V501_05197 [Pseudogymnoascus sp. VKM F-4519 (FW-2642)]|nr:hypothetical protein V501_05197 [Pseudogymnoascus sp. VKM F-4519 (FW-2642)]